MNIKTSIVIVSWNVRELLLDSFINFYDKSDIEIIVIDNNSQDGTAELLKKDFPKVILIENMDNPGFAKANNQGFEICTGLFTYILNPDTRSTYSDLLKLIQVLDENKDIGGVSPLIRYGNGQIQKSCARKFPSFWTYLITRTLRFNQISFLKKWINHRLIYPYNYHVSQKIECCSGAAYLIRTDLLREIGGFGSDFIHTGEDLDLMKNVQKFGYSNYLCAGSELIHLAGQSSKQNIPRSYINSILSSFIYIKIHQGNFFAFLYRLSIYLIDLPISFLILSTKKMIGNKTNKMSFRDFKIVLIGLLRWKEIK